MKRPREARKGGVWIVQVGWSHGAPQWCPIGDGDALQETKRGALDCLKRIGKPTDGLQYRAVRYVPANPRRSTP